MRKFVRKFVMVLLLSVVLEVTGFLPGLQPFRGKSGPGPAVSPQQQVKPAKARAEKPREEPKADQASPEGGSGEGPSAREGDPPRNPFALPDGIRSLNQAPGAAAALSLSDEAGASRAAVPEPPARELSGILVGPRDRVAIINGTLLRTGESLEGEHLIDIRRDHVVLARDGQRRTLRLPPPFPESGQGTGRPEPPSSADRVNPKRSNGAAKP